MSIGQLFTSSKKVITQLMQKQQGWVLTSPDLVFANFYFFHFFPRHFLQQYRRHRIHSFTNTKHTTTLVAAAVKKRTEGRRGGGCCRFWGLNPGGLT